MQKELKTYNCIIIDDEKYARELIVQYLKKYSNINVLGKFKRTALAKPLLTSEVRVDIIFLDIQMPDETGLEFLQNNTIISNVIFTTAYSEYAVESYNFNVIDYLLKPIQEKRFEQAINKFFNKIETTQKINTFTKLINEKDNFILLKSGAKSQKIKHSELIYLKSESEYISYVTTVKKHLLLGSLKKVKEQLPNQFIHVHRSYIVNSNKIKARLNNSIILENETSIPIGKTYRKEVISLLKTKGF